ncbi:MAG: diacylglycerol/polyprenol kinase family protein [Candidatus Thorarchaeota archaeon]
MVFNPIGTELELVWDIIAGFLTLFLVVLVIPINATLKRKELISANVSRKVIHIFGSPIFVESWLLYSGGVFSRVTSLITPILLVLMFIGIGTGRVKNDDFVESMSRSGEPGELLKGTLYYALAGVIVTILWFYQPVSGPANPMAFLIVGCLAGGDGLADIVGRKYGGERKFGIAGAEKTVAGSIGMFLGSFISCYILIAIISIEVVAFDLVAFFLPIFIIGAAATIIEALSPPSIDNWTICTIVVITAALLSTIGLWPYPLLTL